MCGWRACSVGGVRATLAFQGDVSTEGNAIDLLIAAHEFLEGPHELKCKSDHSVLLSRLITIVSP